MSESLSGSNPTDSTKLKAGSMVGSGRFTLIKELGRGGMGVVWLAQDTNLGEQVALKFLPPEVASDPVSVNDLRRETVRSHRLTHPNIVRIHDFHQPPEGLAFISMEYVDGLTLSGWRLQQDKQVFTWDQLDPLAQQLCDALEYAHGEGVIHRDLKPGNVMLDSRGRVKLADFGIAAVVSDSMSRVSVRSSTGGTLAYMSPQQLAGSQPTVADDIYALGATLYELLSGRPPFYRGDITHQVVNLPAQPLNERLLALGIDNPVPPEVAALIMACLAKQPDQRPQSARAVAQWMISESLPGTEAQAIAPARPANLRLRLGLGLAACVILIAGMALLINLGNRKAKLNSDLRSQQLAAHPADPPSTGVRTSAAPRDFTPLFNSKDLIGWWGAGTEDPRKYLALSEANFKQKRESSLTDIHQHWRVENGELVNDGNGLFLTTDRSYEDFELLADYRTVPKADSGIYLRGYPQVQIWDYTDSSKFALGSDKGSGGLWNNSEGSPGKSPLVKADKPFGEWNHLRILMAGSRVWVWLNDRQTVDGAILENYFDRKQQVSPKGPIQLQTHGGEIRWRNLFIRELGKDEASRVLQGPGPLVERAEGSQSKRWTNSLGMVFVPVSGTEVLFGIWETRVRDFESFVKAVRRDMGNGLMMGRADGWKVRPGYSWQNPGFQQSPNHPVVGVNWEDAQAFCEWLTQEDRRKRMISAQARYRLPSDAEWSAAVGPARFPWGDAWPPPSRSGNYAGLETVGADWPVNSWGRMTNYTDDHVFSAPVGSYPSNALGLFDLGGNVWEWCGDYYRAEMNPQELRAAFPSMNNDGGGQRKRVFRGGSWVDPHLEILASANRLGTGDILPEARCDTVGFRVVLVPDLPAASQSPGRTDGKNPNTD